MQGAPGLDQVIEGVHRPVVWSQIAAVRGLRDTPTMSGREAARMPNLGPMEILVVLIVALIVLGPKRLPEAGRQVGRAVAEVRRWSNTMQAEVKAVLDDDVEAPPPVPWNPPPGTRLQPPAEPPADTAPR